MDIPYFWAMQAWMVRLILLVQFSLFVVSLVRFARLFRWLCIYRRSSFSPQQVANGVADAAYALTHRAPTEPSGSVIPPAMAETEFLYRCEKCSIEVESTKRTAWHVFLLTLIGVAFVASQFYRINCNQTFSNCLILETIQLCYLPLIGWSVSAILYFASSFFERKLSTRRADWKYFFARSRQQ
jgi:hypothetical protein